MIITVHKGKGVAGDNPENVPRFIVLDSHDDIGGEAVVGAEVPQAVLACHIDAVAVGTHDDVAVCGFCDGKDFRIDDPVILSDAADNGIPADDADTARIGYQDRAVLRLGRDANPL